MGLSTTLAWRAPSYIPSRLNMATRPEATKTVFDSARSMANNAGNPRMRFAPSPTGSLHVGGARTALYNWLIARQAQHGKFVLRIEDTDLARSTQESEESMLEDLEWLGLFWDEGPEVGGPCGSYRQSERSQIYREAADFLLHEGQAYPCFCTDEELDAKRIAAKMAGTQVSYDGTWRDADSDEIQRLLKANTPHTYRFRTPQHKVVSVDDKVRGRIEWDVQATIGDFVLLRSNGVPVYNFCVAVDDALMGVTTVVRAEEHLTNTVRQLLVLEALGFEKPMYGHASLILGNDKSKLSKRHGATSCGQFRERGYLPDAMINYLALLGWNDGTSKEIYSRQELIEAFDLSRVTASPAMFDDAKLRWINGQHLRAMPIAELVPLVMDHLTSKGLLPTGKCKMDATAAASAVIFTKTLTTVTQPKAELVTDIAEAARAALTYPLLETISLRENGVVDAVLLKRIRMVLDDDFASFALALVASYDRREAPAFCYDAGLACDADSGSISNWLGELGSTLGRSKKRLLMPARLALTGQTTGMELPSQLQILQCATRAGCGNSIRVSLNQRMAILRNFTYDAPDVHGVATIPEPASSDRNFNLAAFSKLRQVYESNRRTATDDATMMQVLKDAYDSH